MKSFLISALLLLSFGSFAWAQSGYNIKVNIKPFKRQYIYLGYHYGKKKALADSTILDDESNGLFTGNKPLNGGIYFIVSPQKQILFELLIDKQQHFSIVADTANLPGSIKFSGTSDNALFQAYTLRLNQVGKEIASLQEELAQSRNASQQEKLKDKIQKDNQYILSYRDSIEKKNPGNFLASLFQAMKEPVIPPASQHPHGKYDTTFAFEYYKSNYWKGISFTDDRLIRTPILEPKLDKYFRDLVAPDPDSINREVDYMLLLSRTNPEMFKYLMVYFVQKYINPEYMGQDAVFVHIFEKYINTGQAEFFTDQYKKIMSDRAYSLMANLIGSPAANLDMVDTSGKSVQLYDVKADFTVICFWDPTCSHCKEAVPKVDSIYQAKWKAEGVKIFGVMVDGGKENWLKFIKENNLKDWIHVYQTDAQRDEDAKANRPNYRQLYDVYQTPILYLLDKDKRIIAKKLNQTQIDEVINLKRKKQQSQ
jgi:peroxiredoxin